MATAAKVCYIALLMMVIAVVDIRQAANGASVYESILQMSPQTTETTISSEEVYVLNNIACARSDGQCYQKYRTSNKHKHFIRNS